MARPSSSTGSARHESTGVPSTSTVHVPHSPSSQPCLVPVSPRSSRRTSRRVLWTGTRTSWASPLTVRLKRAFIGLPSPWGLPALKPALKILNLCGPVKAPAVREDGMPYARTDDGIRIYYEAHGRGTPLVLAYGIGGNADLWDVNRDALAARHRLVLWEPRGHARSGSPKDPAKYSFA